MNDAGERLPYAMVPIWWWTALAKMQRHRFTAIGVAMVLRRRADSKTLETYPTGLDKIAEELRIHRNRVSDSIKVLLECGIISQQKRGSRAAVYTVHISPVTGDSPKASDSLKVGAFDSPTTGAFVSPKDRAVSKTPCNDPLSETLKATPRKRAKATNRKAKGKPSAEDLAIYAIRDAVWDVLVEFEVDVGISVDDWRSLNKNGAKKLYDGGNSPEMVGLRARNLYADPEMRRYWGDGSIEKLIKAWPRLAPTLEDDPWAHLPSSYEVPVHPDYAHEVFNV